MQFNHVPQQAAAYRRRFFKRFDDVIRSGLVLEGQQNRELRTSLENHFGQDVTLVASGHDALVLSLQALKVRSGDYVVVQANAYPSAFPVAAVGMWLDLDETRRSELC